MPGGKGAQQVGTQTTTQQDPRAVAQTPYLEGGWRRAADLAQDNPITAYPGQTYAQPNPFQYEGLNQLYNAGQNTLGSYGQARNIYDQATGGQYGYTQSPSFNNLMQYAGGSAAPTQFALSNAQTILENANRSSAFAPQQYGYMTGLGNRAADLGTGYGSRIADTGTTYGTGLAGVGQQAADTAARYGDLLTGAAGGALGSGTNFANQLAGTGYQAGGAGAAAARQLNQLAGQIPGMTAPASAMLGYNAATAVGGNPAYDLLGRQARGEFLNSNPYLDQMFNNAADPVTRRFQTAISPMEASKAALAGRSNSGYLNNAQTQAQLNLGQTLSGLAGDIYGKNYAAERGLMDAAAGNIGSLYNSGLGLSNQAASALGNLGLGSADAIRNALTGASQQRLQGLNQQANALAGGATAGQGAYGQYLSGLGTAAQEANRGLSTQASALGAGGTLAERGLADAASAAQQGLQNAITAGQAGGSQYLTGLRNAADSAYNAGNLNISAGSQQLQGLRDLTGAYNTSIDNLFRGANMAPSLSSLYGSGAGLIRDAGTGFQTLEQAQLADAQKRFQEEQDAPRRNLTEYMKAISGNVGNNTVSTQPIYGSPLAQGIGALGSLNSGLGMLTGNNSAGLLGNIGGLGSALGFGSAASPVLAGIGSGALPAVIAPEIGAAGLTALAGANASLAPALAAAAPAAAATIVCTELVAQGRMPNTWRLAGMRQFMRYPAIARRGYWVWATPVVHHLRTKPNSRFSRTIAKAFNWRAEDLAARNGVKGARRLLRGRLVTAAMVLPCLACGLVANREWTPTGKDAPA